MPNGRKIRSHNEYREQGIGRSGTVQSHPSIEDREIALPDVDVAGAKGILHDLDALRKQLEKNRPNSERVLALVNRLGQATTKIAEKSDKQPDKLLARGDALTEARDEVGDEAEDDQAAASPKPPAEQPAKKRQE